MITTIISFLFSLSATLLHYYSGRGSTQHPSILSKGEWLVSSLFSEESFFLFQLASLIIVSLSHPGTAATSSPSRLTSLSYLLSRNTNYDASSCFSSSSYTLCTAAAIKLNLFLCSNGQFTSILSYPVS